MISRTYYKRLLSLLLVLNLWDAIATTYWVMSGLATEANPFMDALLRKNPSLFIITKTFLVSLCVGLLWRVGVSKTSVLLLFPSLFLYIYVSLVHIFFFFAFLTGSI